MSQTAPEPASSPAAALLERLRHDPASPLITYYDPDTGERIEVSAVTFVNWVSKTANLMRDGLGTPDEPAVLVTLRPHWQTLAVVHAVWSLGGSIAIGPAPGIRYDVAFTSPGEAEEGAALADDVVVLALRAMALPGDPAPAPAVDFDREVRTYGDRFTGPAVDPDSPALTIGAEGALSQRELVAWAHRLAIDPSAAAGDRRLVLDASALPAPVCFIGALIAMACGTGIVLGSGPLSASIVEQEQATIWSPASTMW